MTICPHTGVSQPECSCRACLQAQIEQHMPSLLIREGEDLPSLVARVEAGRGRSAAAEGPEIRIPREQGPRTPLARAAAALRPRLERRRRAA